MRLLPILLPIAAFLVPGFAQAEVPRVAVTIKPLHSLVAAVMGELGQPALIVDGVASPHSYSLTPSDAETLQAAELVFWTGHGLELFLEDALHTIAAEANVVELAATPGLELLPVRAGGAFEAHAHEAEGAHGHEAIDMHFWLDPHNGARLVTAIADALAVADPEHAGAYAANAESYNGELAALTDELDAALATVRDVKFIVFHDALHYFEARFGLTAAGAITVLTTSATALDDDMLRAQVTFRYEGERPLVWYVGVVPDRSALTGATTTFAEVQLREADSLVPYVPGFAERGVTSLRASRLPVWEDALAAISARPLLGWGPNGLATAVNDLMPLESRLRPVAAHAHNMVLAIWVDRGLVGVIGLIVLVAVLGLRAVQQRDRPAVIVIGGALVLNLFDATLLSGTIIYPLAAVLGWRAVGHRRIATAETGVGSAAAVRVSLAVGDMAAGAIALSIGMLFGARFDPELTLASGWSPALAYATLVWPLVAGWSGLYPGYGLPAHRELAKSVQSAGAASLLIAFASLFLPDTIPLPTGAMVIAALTSVILAPVFRALIKHMLRALHIWGRAVVMLGNGTAAQRTVSHLIEHPSVGLYPVAAFGDGATWAQERLPLTGTLEHAWRYIEDNNIRHAIVTPDAALELGFDEVLRRADRQLRYVQYLPDLKGLPSSSVVATPLGTFLALEVRNQLASGTNRAVKRTIDLVVASVLLVLLAVPLLLIALLVRLDSKGHPLHLSPRVGRYGKTFTCIKFRTMHLDAQQRLEHILATDPERQTEYEQFRKLSRDPRVTRVGRVLRRLSLDEFPQLINVVMGQMSLVGPRPYLVSELEAMGPDRDLIFLARPGMTGYWQIEARNDVSFEERQAMEADYVRNWSVWWDISILLATPLAMLGPDGK